MGAIFLSNNYDAASPHKSLRVPAIDNLRRGFAAKMPKRLLALFIMRDVGSIFWPRPSALRSSRHRAWRSRLFP
jgi:hypothetical protein